MTYANVGTLGTTPGSRDRSIEVLTRRSDLRRELGCQPLRD